MHMTLYHLPETFRVNRAFFAYPVALPGYAESACSLATLPKLWAKELELAQLEADLLRHLWSWTERERYVGVFEVTCLAEVGLFRVIPTCNSRLLSKCGGRRVESRALDDLVCVWADSVGITDELAVRGQAGQSSVLFSVA